MSQFINNPTKEHIESVCRILRFLKLTLGKELLFRKNNTRELDIYISADHIGNILDKHLTFGHCLYVWGNLVTWRSKKQLVILQSCVKFEFRSLPLVICEGIEIQKLLSELGMIDKQPIGLFSDT